MNCKRKYVLKKHAESMEKKKNNAIDKIIQIDQDDIMPKDELLVNDMRDKGEESSLNS